MINPGEGYRLLNKGEIIQQGDEFTDTIKQHVWCTTNNEGFVVGSDDVKNLTYRRKVEGKIVWRLLEDGEVIQQGDEYYSTMKGCWLVHPPRIGIRHIICEDVPFRRKVTLPSLNEKGIADLNKQLQELNDALVGTEKNLAKLLKENRKLVEENQSLSNLKHENLALQRACNTKNEKIWDLEFAIREIRKNREIQKSNKNPLTNS